MVVPKLFNLIWQANWKNSLRMPPFSFMKFSFCYLPPSRCTQIFLPSFLRLKQFLKIFFFFSLTNVFRNLNLLWQLSWYLSSCFVYVQLQFLLTQTNWFTNSRWCSRHAGEAEADIAQAWSCRESTHSTLSCPRSLSSTVPQDQRTTHHWWTGTCLLYTCRYPIRSTNNVAWVSIWGTYYASGSKYHLENKRPFQPGL